MTLLFGFAGLIMENRFLSELSTPLQKPQYYDLHEVTKHEFQYEAFKKKEYGGNFETFLQKIVHQGSENNAGDSEENTSETRNLAVVDSKELVDHSFEFIENELLRAKAEMAQNNIKAALNIYEYLALLYPVSPAAIYGKAYGLQNLASFTESNEVLQASVQICLQYVEYDRNFSDEDFKKLSYYCINHMRLNGYLSSAIPLLIILINRFDDDPRSRNELASTYIAINRTSDAKDLLEQNIKRWPNNGIALVQYGLLLLNTSYEDGIHYLRLGIETNDEETQQIAFYSSLGDALLQNNRTNEGREIFRKGVALKIFPSEFQRPHQFFQNLKAQPIWMKEETSFIDMINLLESNWRQIRDEAMKVQHDDGYFEKERTRSTGEILDREALIDFGDWQEYLLFTRGHEEYKNCERVKFTCALIRTISENLCDMGNVLFSAIHPGTHVIPHCGPHNGRLRTHLGLKVPKGAKIRVAEYERSWEEGKLFLFDDSFEHEIWNNGSGIRLVLLIDFWHPEIREDYKKLLKKERNKLVT